MFEKCLTFFTILVFATSTFAVMGAGRTTSILAGCLAGYLAVILFNYLQGDYSNKGGNKEQVGEYRYQFQQHPFGDFHTFSVQAASQIEANIKAQEVFATLVAENKTVMRIFYPAT